MSDAETKDIELTIIYPELNNHTTLGVLTVRRSATKTDIEEMVEAYKQDLVSISWKVVE